MKTFICKGCTRPFKAEQRREFCCLVCVDNYEDDTGKKVELDPVLAAQERSIIASNELDARESGCDSIYDEPIILPVERNGRIVHLPSPEMSNGELRRIADGYIGDLSCMNSSESANVVTSRWDYLEIQR